MFASLYDAVRAEAWKVMLKEHASHTLQATALAHEALLKLLRSEKGWNDRDHFLATAARMMRHILVDHARTRTRQKRPPPNRRVELDELTLAIEERSGDLRDLDEALERLAAVHQRPARIVEMHFFAGLGLPVIARTLRMPLRRVEREWRFARAWLRAELS